MGDPPRQHPSLCASTSCLQTPPRQGSAATEHVMCVVDLHARHGQPVDDNQRVEGRQVTTAARSSAAAPPSSASPLPKRATVAIHPTWRLAHNVRCSEVNVVARCAGGHARRGRLVVVTNAASRRGCVHGDVPAPIICPLPLEPDAPLTRDLPRQMASPPCVYPSPRGTWPPSTLPLTPHRHITPNTTPPSSPPYYGVLPTRDPSCSSSWCPTRTV